MKKLVLRTVLITLALIISALAIVFGALAIFAPKSLGNFFDKMGGYNASIKFYEKQYDKTGDLNDLAFLCDKIDMEKDGARAEKYLLKLTADEKYSSFCNEKDKDNGANDIPSKEYYKGEYALALANNGKFDKALDVCRDFVRSYGYTKYNPTRTLVTSYAPKASLSELKALKTRVNNDRGNNNEQRDYAITDSNVLTHMINDFGKEK